MLNISNILVILDKPDMIYELNLLDILYILYILYILDILDE